MHLRKKNVAPKVGGIFAGVGLVGSLIGAYLGHITPGTDLLTYFAIAMIALGIYMAIRRESSRAGTVDEVNHVIDAFQRCKNLTLSTILKVLSSALLLG